MVWFDLGTLSLSTIGFERAQRGEIAEVGRSVVMSLCVFFLLSLALSLARALRPSRSLSRALSLSRLTSSAEEKAGVVASLALATDRVADTPLP